MKSKKYMFLAALAFLVIFLCTLQPTQAQYTADGEPVIYYVGPLDIVTPVNTTTYAQNQDICLNFTVYAHFDPNVADVTIVYSLDGKNNVTIPTSSKYVPVWITDANGNPTDRALTLYSYYTIAGFVNLENLSQGSHNLTVFARYDDHGRDRVYFDDQTIYFTIDKNFVDASEAQNSQATTSPASQETIYSSTKQSSIIFTPITILLIGIIGLIIISITTVLGVLLFLRRRQS